jgi:hypothetical protein
MRDTALLGVQVTLVGLFMVTFFEGVPPFPLIGFLMGLLGTAVFAAGYLEL